MTKATETITNSVRSETDQVLLHLMEWVLLVIWDLLIQNMRDLIQKSGTSNHKVSDTNKYKGINSMLLNQRDLLKIHMRDLVESVNIMNLI